MDITFEDISNLYSSEYYDYEMGEIYSIAEIFFIPDNTNLNVDNAFKEKYN